MTQALECIDFLLKKYLGYENPFDFILSIKFFLLLRFEIQKEKLELK